MPWEVEKREGKRPWKIVKKGTGEVVGSAKSKEAAEKSVKARYAGMHGTSRRMMTDGGYMLT